MTRANLRLAQLALLWIAVVNFIALAHEGGTPLPSPTPTPVPAVVVHGTVITPEAFLACLGAFVGGIALSIRYLNKIWKQVVPSEQKKSQTNDLMLMDPTGEIPKLQKDNKTLADTVAQIARGVARLEDNVDEDRKDRNRRERFIDEKFHTFETDIGSIRDLLRDADAKRDHQTKTIVEQISALEIRVGNIEDNCPAGKKLVNGKCVEDSL